MLEQTEKLEPRVSALEEDLSDIEEESEEEEVCYGLRMYLGTFQFQALTVHVCHHFGHNLNDTYLVSRMFVSMYTVQLA